MFTLIIDLDTNSYTSVPNILIDDFNKLSKSNKEINHPLLQFLLSKNIIYKCDLKLKKRIEQKHNIETPTIINDLIVDLNQKNAIIFDILYVLNIEAVGILIDDILTINLIDKYLKESTQKISIYLHNEQSLKFITDVINSYQNIVEVYLFNCEKLQEIELGGIKVTYLNYGYNDLISSDLIDSYSFSVTKRNYFESDKANTFFYKKIFVSKEGYVGNTPNFSDVNVSLNSLVNIESFIEFLSSKQFQKYWHTPKTKIQICEYCEFNRICIDKRTPIHNGKVWYYESECNYNPFISKWLGDDGYIDLKNTGVSFVETQGYFLEKVKIKSKIREIWGI